MTLGVWWVINMMAKNFCYNSAYSISLMAAAMFLLLTFNVNSVESMTLSLTISAQSRRLEVAWLNARVDDGDLVVITRLEPAYFRKIKYDDGSGGGGVGSGDDGSGSAGRNFRQFSAIYSGINYSDNDGSGGGAGGIDGVAIGGFQSIDLDPVYCRNRIDLSGCRNDSVRIEYIVRPETASGWITTRVPYDYALSKQITIDTRCYGFWATYINRNGTILERACLRAEPTWMNDMRSRIQNFRIRDLFIPGAHDSGSYRNGFDPQHNETLVTKYSLTQDEDIRGQLMHGIRYLDIRIGFYKKTDEQFWVNHGISKQIPLMDVINQVRDFVIETNEIVIFDIQEFPVGFGKTLDIHRKLVYFLQTNFKDLLVDPRLTWQAKLKEIWYRNTNVILGYDLPDMVNEFPDILFQSVEQKWGNVQDWPSLERHLIKSNQQSLLRSLARPVADMAELTPSGWGVIVDSYGGLRRMADEVNRHVSNLYRKDLSHSANVVAVDFFRGTSIVDIAIKANAKRVAH